MPQGSQKAFSRKPDVLKKMNSAKIKKAQMKAKLTPKGNSVELPKGKFRDEAIVDRELSKAIDKASEQKMAAKVIQGGGKMKTTDLTKKGKELSREMRRKQVKVKLTRVEEKLKALTAAAEKKGLL